MGPVDYVTSFERWWLVLAFQSFMCIVLPLKENLLFDKLRTLRIYQLLLERFVLKQVKEMKAMGIPEELVLQLV